jgi:uncharacterized protein (TIRG00374 family)
LKKTITLIAGFVISLALLYVVLQRIVWGDLLGALKTTRLSLVAAAVLLRMAVFLLRALRWRRILSPAGYSPGLGDLFPPLMVGFFSNYLLPAKAGELVRAFLLKRRTGMPKSSILTTIVVEKFLDMVILASFLLGPLITMPMPDWIGGFGVTSAVILALFLGIFFLFLRYSEGLISVLTSLASRLGEGVTSRIGYYTRAVEQGFGILRKVDHLGAALFLSALIWGTNALVLWMLGESMSLEVPLSAYLVLMVVFNLAAIIPSLPGRLGTLEFVFVAVMAVFGVEATPALTLSILFRATHPLPLLIGYLFMVREGYQLGGGEGDDEPAEDSGGAESSMG